MCKRKTEREGEGNLGETPQPTPFSHLHQTNQTAGSRKNIAASENAKGSGHLCLHRIWGQVVWRDTKDEIKKSEGQESEKNGRKK